MAAAAARSSQPASAATGASAALSPSTAVARATARASADSRASRNSTVPETARGPIARTTAAWSASGRTPSASSARNSWRSSSGLPPVAS